MWTTPLSTTNEQIEELMRTYVRALNEWRTQALGYFREHISKSIQRARSSKLQR